MQLLLKVGNKRLKDHSAFLKSWRDGQIVDIRPNGFYAGRMIKRHFCVIETPHDYWTVRGSTDLKSTKSSVLELKQNLEPVDINGKYKWEIGYLEDEKRLRCRDWFVDFKDLFDKGLITLSDFDSIYAKDKDHNSIYVDRNLSAYLFHEDIKTRKVSKYSDNLGTIAAGTYSIGSGLDYDTVAVFEADIAAQLTGNLTGEQNDENTTLSSGITFDTDTNTFLLKITAQSGKEHNGTFGNATHQAGDGARITLTSFDSLNFDETIGGDLDDVEISNLVLDIAGANNEGIRFSDGSDSGLFTVNRNIISGDANTLIGINQSSGAVDNVQATNNIIYGISGGDGIAAVTRFASNIFFANNTIAKCSRGIRQNSSTFGATFIVKNNLCQGNTADFSDAGAGFGTTAKNVSEDTTSPDVSYRSLNCHDGNSCFQDYSNDDYRLVSTGDEMTTLDDGDDLSGTFTDDVIGTTRSTWYIGAYEYVVVGIGASFKNINPFMPQIYGAGSVLR